MQRQPHGAVAMQHLHLDLHVLPAVAPAILEFFTMAEARALRLVCSTLREAVTEVPWMDSKSRIAHGPRWAKCFPRALAAKSALGGEAATSLLAVLPGVPQLSTLNVDVHPGNTVQASAVLDGLRAVPKLVHLLLRGRIHLGAKGQKILEEMVFSVPRLESLELHNTLLHPGSFRVLAHSLSALPQLKTLDLSRNPGSVGDEGIVALAAGLSGIPLLKKLNLSYDFMRDAGAMALASALRHLPLLETLDLSSNNVGTIGAAALGSALAAVPLLRVLELGYNNIGRDGAKALLPALHAVPLLQRLGLAQNVLRVEGVKAVASALPGVPQLQELFLDHSSLDIPFFFDAPVDECIVMLAAALPSVPQLRTLHLHYNGIENKGAIALALALPSIPQLGSLSLNGNRIGDEGVASLAAALTESSQLTSLQLNLHFNYHCGVASLEAIILALRRGAAPRLTFLEIQFVKNVYDLHADLLTVLSEQIDNRRNRAIGL